ncbi:hypothetical protein SprV_0301353800 [Sparganum proliferum]
MLCSRFSSLPTPSSRWTYAHCLVVQATLHRLRPWAVRTMSDRPHRARKPNKKYDKRDFVSGDEQSSSPKSESLSESSETIPGCMSSSFLLDNLEAQVRRLVAASTPLPIEEGPAWQQVSSLAAYDRLCAALSDGQYRRRLICYLSGAGGENTKSSIFGSQIYDLILDVFNKWCASHASDRQKLEDAFKNVFKRAHDRQQRKCNKASTSVLQNDTQPAADLDKTPDENL